MTELRTFILIFFFLQLLLLANLVLLRVLIRVATKKSAQEKDAAHSLSSLFIVPAASPIHDFAEMHGRTVAITDSQSFDGWQIAKGEISKHGQDPDRFFSEVYETHYGIPDVATLVSQGFADVGVLSTCEFESMELRGRLKGRISV